MAPGAGQLNVISGPSSMPFTPAVQPFRAAGVDSFGQPVCLNLPLEKTPITRPSHW